MRSHAQSFPVVEILILLCCATLLFLSCDRYELKKGHAMLDKAEKAEGKKIEAKEKQMALLRKNEQEAMASLKSKRPQKAAKGKNPATDNQNSKTKATASDGSDASDSSTDDDAPVGKLKSASAKK